MRVNSEINQLRKVLLHRPGKELEVLNDNNMHHYLFDELPDLKIAQKEHDIFANVLSSNNVEVVYLEDLMVDILKDENVKERFIKDYLKEANCNDENIYYHFLQISDLNKLVLETMAGIAYHIEPMPNLYFTRDTFTIIDNCIALYHMHSDIRNREGIYGEYINKYHKDFGLPIVYERDYDEKIEGGDVVLLNKDTLAVGISERTNFNAALRLARNVIRKANINKVLTIEIPNRRSCMHLDTVFTKINDNQFVFFNECYQYIKLNLITNDNIEKINKPFKEALCDTLSNNNISFIKVDNPNDQWNDACNTLCISPNNFVVYDINKKVNETFIQNGSNLHYIPSKELLKGRGGPHCMSMPLIRD